MATITEKPSRMHEPAHPGEILAELYMKPMRLTVTEVAQALGVSRKHLSAIVNARAPVTPDMAARLAGVFATEPEIWVNLQAQRDVWDVSQRAAPKVKALRRAA